MARQTTKTAPKVGMPLHVPTSVYVATNETTASWKVRCETLATLTVPSKSIVDQLCGWAHEYRHVPDAAAEIARQLQFHLDTRPITHHVALFYVLDSFVKNIGEPYRTLFSERLCEQFKKCFTGACTAETRFALNRMVGSWDKALTFDRALLDKLIQTIRSTPALRPTTNAVASITTGTSPGSLAPAAGTAISPASFGHWMNNAAYLSNLMGGAHRGETSPATLSFLPTSRPDSGRSPSHGVSPHRRNTTESSSNSRVSNTFGVTSESMRAQRREGNQHADMTESDERHRMSKRIYARSRSRSRSRSRERDWMGPRSRARIYSRSRSRSPPRSPTARPSDQIRARAAAAAAATAAARKRHHPGRHARLGKDDDDDDDADTSNRGNGRSAVIRLSLPPPPVSETANRSGPTALGKSPTVPACRPSVPNEASFSASFLNTRHQQVIDSLYTGLSLQCKTCGQRFLDREELAVHLDWHFKTANVSLRLQTHAAKAHSRQWFIPSEKEWSNMVDSDTRPAPRQQAEFFLSQLEAKKATTAALTEKEMQMLVPVADRIVADDTQTHCLVCGDAFTSWLDQDQGEWYYQNATRVSAIPWGGGVLPGSAAAAAESKQIVHRDCVHAHAPTVDVGAAAVSPVIAPKISTTTHTPTTPIPCVADTVRTM